MCLISSIETRLKGFVFTVTSIGALQRGSASCSTLHRVLFMDDFSKSEQSFMFSSTHWMVAGTELEIKVKICSGCKSSNI